jgi:hypothetical protein
MKKSAQPGWAGQTKLPSPKIQPPVPTAVPTAVAAQVDLEIQFDLALMVRASD